MTKLLKFYAPWCRPCTELAPVVTKVTEALGIPVEEINIDSLPEAATQWGVRSLPTLILLQDEKEVHRHIGSANAETLKKTLEPFL